MAYTKEERERNKSILVATLNYLLEYHANDIVFDDYSPSKERYLRELEQTELDIQKSQSKEIEKRLNKHISFLKYRVDLGLNNYIKKNTRYDIDIFKEYKVEAEEIVLKEEIEFNDVVKVKTFLKAYDADPDQQKNITILKGLLTKYENDLAELLRSEVVVEVIYGISIGNKSWEGNEAAYKEKVKEFNKDWLLAEELAPDGTTKLQVQFSGKGEHALTYVVILLNTGSGTIYCARGEKLPIKAYWKDKNTVVIETKKAYSYHDKYHQVSSYDEVYKIEYRYI